MCNYWQNGHDVIILDNLCNSKRSVLPVIERLGGKHPTFVEGDIRNEALMTEILHDHAIDTVIHFAGLKSRRRIGTKTAGILRQQCQRHSAPD
ncbi:UDP-galactose-4-epimerase [Escherichia coli]|nr:UDP-galactose-4-epimerase [Escherichia coli]